MRIVYLTSGNGKDGAGRLALDIAVGLVRLGHSVVWVAEPLSVLNAEAGQAGLDVQCFPECASKVEKREHVASVSVGADIVNCHYSPDRKLALRAGVQRGSTKLIFTRHAQVRQLGGSAKFRYGHRVAGHIAVSREVHNGILHSGVPSRKTALVYGGIDTQRFHQQLAEHTEIEGLRTPGRLNIGIIGRFIADDGFQPHHATRKGHADLFRAVAKLLEITDIDCQVLIIGNGPNQVELIQSVAKHCGLAADRLVFAGFVSPVTPAYKSCDVVVLPSDEGLGLTLIESLSAGIPAIGHVRGGTSEIITHGRDGFLVDPEKVTAFCEVLRQCLTNNQLRRYCAENSPRKAELLFDIERVVLQTEHCYQQWVGLPSETLSKG